ncbi:MAG: response regulator [Longimicrobiales bacterium]
MQKTILVIEDQQEIRQLYATVLRSQGYWVVEAGDGREGLERARDLHPDLILMDLAMPVLDGREAAARLRQDPTTRHITVIAVTALNYDDMQAAAFDAYLTKPISAKRLLREVRNYIGRGDDGGSGIQRGAAA